MEMEEGSEVSLRSSAHLLLLKSWMRRPQGIGHNFLSFLHDRGQMIFILKAFRIDLIDVLGAGRTGCEPASVSHNLKPADRGAVPWGGSQFGCNSLASDSISGNCCWRQLLQSRFFIWRRWRI